MMTPHTPTCTYAWSHVVASRWCPAAALHAAPTSRLPGHVVDSSARVRVATSVCVGQSSWCPGPACLDDASVVFLTQLRRSSVVHGKARDLFPRCAHRVPLWAWPCDLAATAVHVLCHANVWAWLRTQSRARRRVHLHPVLLLPLS